MLFTTSILELAHAKSHTQTTSMRKIVNDKAREYCVNAREYQRKKVERIKSCLRRDLKLQTKNLDSE